jgi:hypothetical protein
MHRRLKGAVIDGPPNPVAPILGSCAWFGERQARLRHFWQRYCDASATTRGFMRRESAAMA